jgi:glycosyltransferase involved in cell wall biosynthesis
LSYSATALKFSVARNTTVAWSRYGSRRATTCARDYITWKNEYPEGTDRVRGVTVRRFANAHTRDIDAFNQYSDWIFSSAHTRDDERKWLEMQGPWCPALLDHLARHHRSYDALIFFTYLYAPTVLGMEIDPNRSILVPTAHDEPAIHLDIYQDLFRLPAAVAFNTEVEKNFLKSTFEIRAVAEETVGCGVDLLQGDADAPPGSSSGDVDGDDDAEHVDVVAQIKARGVAFRRRHRLYGDFLLYGGRIDAGKGCEELLEYFTSYKELGGDASLVLMGVKLMQLPEVPWVNFAGLLSERERLQALEAATVVVVPSPYESLSLLALEAMAVGTPVLCNGRSEVLVEHCRQSNAGLYYQNRDEFIECTALLLDDDRLRRAMGRNGKDYVKRNYRWDVILAKYDRLIAAARTR